MDAGQLSIIIMKEIENVAEIEISYRPAIANKPIIKSSLDAYVILKEFFPVNTVGLQEHFTVMFMNRSNRVLGLHPLSRGGISSCLVDVRLILSIALKTASTGIVLSHNHPSGNLNPSRQDIDLTAKIKEACKFFDIAVLDHIIISPEERQYFSFSDEGML